MNNLSFLNIQHQRKAGLPISTLFSRGFISFSKSKDIAEEFIYNSNKNTLLILTNPPDKNEIFAQADIHFLSDMRTRNSFFPFCYFWN